MTIRNMERYVAALWDWGWLNKCFAPSRIRLSDIDGIVECKNRFLVIEGKGRGVDVPGGQGRMFNAMTAAGFTVLVVYGQPPDEVTHWRVWPRPPIAGNVSDVVGFVRDWYRAVSA